MPTTRSELLIKEVFCSGFTWSDIENLFSINRNFLFEEIKNFFSSMSDGDSRLEQFEARIKLNEK